MAVEHRIRKNGKGDTYIVKLTSLTAIRKNCLECMGWLPDEIRNCTSPLCALYPFRFGKNPSYSGTKRKRPNKGIEALRKYRENRSTT